MHIITHAHYCIHICTWTEAMECITQKLRVEILHLPEAGPASMKSPSTSATTGALYKLFHGIFRRSLSVQKSVYKDWITCIIHTEPRVLMTVLYMHQ